MKKNNILKIETIIVLILVFIIGNSTIVFATANDKVIFYNGEYEYYFKQLNNQISIKTYKVLKKDSSGKGSVTVKFDKEIRIRNDKDFDKNYDNAKLPVTKGAIAFSLDHPDRYWYEYVNIELEGSLDKEKNIYIFSKANINSNINSKLYTKDKIAKFNKKVNDICNAAHNKNLDLKMVNNYRLAQYYHNYLVNNVKYVKNRDYHYDQLAYAAIVDGKCVCNGYARAFQLLCVKSGIPCITVDGYVYGAPCEDPGFHAWNMIYINQQWYGVDCTWDDSDVKGYGYFLRGEKFNKHHTKDWYRQYHINFKIPTISKTDFKGKESIIFAKSIKLNKQSATLKKGSKISLKATISPSNTTFTELKWKSSNSKVATVDDNGNVKALSNGTTKITATAISGNVSAVCKITVRN